MAQCLPISLSVNHEEINTSINTVVDYTCQTAKGTTQGSSHDLKLCLKSDVQHFSKATQIISVDSRFKDYCNFAKCHF